MKKIVLLALALVLLSTAVIGRFTKPVEASGTITIKADGSIDPPDAPINTTDMVTYYFTSNINDSIVVERDNIVVDGACYTVQGTGVNESKGIYLDGRSNVTIKNMTIKTFYYGIWLVFSSSNSISGNNITANNGYGILLDSSSSNSISGNNITANNEEGIWLYSSSSNSISRNNVTNNGYGIWLDSSSNNTIFHNNFVNNSVQVYSNGSVNIWDDNYPSGGNYLSDYIGVDLYSGIYQNMAGSDGIGDTSRTIDADNVDKYPLMGLVNAFDIGTWNGTACNVDVVSNTAVSNFQLNVAKKIMSFNVTGIDFTADFCRVTIPNVIVQDLWHRNYAVLLNSEPWFFRNWTDTTNTYVYINYTHTEHEITIVPEFPSILILPLFALTTLIATILLKKKRKPKLQSVSCYW